MNKLIPFTSYLFAYLVQMMRIHLNNQVEMKTTCYKVI